MIDTLKINISNLIQGSRMSSQSQLRILEVVQSLEKGGRTKRFSDTVFGLRNQSQYVTPLCLSQPDPWIEIPKLEIIERKKNSALQLIRRIRQLIKKHDIKLIHAHCELSQLYAGIAGFTCGVPTVGTFHRSNLSKYQPSKVNTLLKLCLSEYIAVSHDRLSLLTHNLALPTYKCHVVHGGAIIEDPPTETSITNARNILKIPKEQLVLLSIGHLGTIKGHQDTIIALSALITDYNHLHLYIAGDGSKEQKDILLNLIKKLDLKDYITFLGQIHNAPQWLEACDIFVQPSIEEAFGLVFAEAGAKSKPVVATCVGGIKEIIIDGKTGYLVAPAAPEKISQALKKLLEFPEERILFGENGYLRISTQFSMDSMINKYLTIFSKVVK
jgi:glycosyltransferase involved in cell wall biosynthesis